MRNNVERIDLGFAIDNIPPEADEEMANDCNREISTPKLLG